MKGAQASSRACLAHNDSLLALSHATASAHFAGKAACVRQFNEQRGPCLPNDLLISPGLAGGLVAIAHLRDQCCVSAQPVSEDGHGPQGAGLSLAGFELSGRC